VPERHYLHADPARVAHYRERIPPGAIGLCWASGRYENANSLRMQPIKSMPLADLEPIWSRYPTVSLQVGQDRAEIAGTPVLDVLPDRPGWDETAALIMACRCVVAVDTAVVHCGGGLGAPVHLLLHNEPNPYFGVRGVASPWYSRFKVYRGEGSD
jgi:hypothetical protein